MAELRGFPAVMDLNPELGAEVDTFHTDIAFIGIFYRSNGSGCGFGLQTPPSM